LHPVTDINVRLPGFDMIELGLFAGLQGGPKYEQPSSDVPLHQASRAEKLKKAICFLRHCTHHITVSRQLALRQWVDGPQPSASQGSGISKSHLHQTNFLDSHVFGHNGNSVIIQDPVATQIRLLHR
jgi:hypothetical protein